MVQIAARTGARRSKAKGMQLRRLVRPLLALSVVFGLGVFSFVAVVSLASIGLKGPNQAFDDAKAIAAISTTTGTVASADTPADWPEPDFPTSDAQQSDEAASKLVGFLTPYDTTSPMPGWAADYRDKIISGVNTDSKTVALTFDDGPSENTRVIVDELNAFGDKATFFWVGARITTDTAEYAVTNGMELANHTWNHPNMVLLNSYEASAEVGLTSARIQQLTGDAPIWFRAPYNRLYSPVWDQVRWHQLLYANFDVMSADWMEDQSDKDIVGKVSSTLRPGGIILMHDSPGRPPTALPQVLQLLKDRGFTSVTLTQLAQMGTPVETPITLGSKGLSWH
jgi:peptidoglycan/xylan/chitin deacetylase (PgdA/CDA1 family)